jgi:hypothetical protein
MARTKPAPRKAKKSIHAARRATVVRRSVSLEPDVDALAHELVGQANFSAFVNEAMREKAQQMQMLRLLDDLDSEYGPIDDDTKKKAEKLWQTASRSTRARSSS